MQKDQVRKLVRQQEEDTRLMQKEKKLLRLETLLMPREIIQMATLH